MAVANGSPINARALLDQNFIATCNLPITSANNTTAGFDLIQTTPYPVTDRVDWQIVVGASVGANNKNMNFAIQGSNDNSNWTNMNWFAAPLFQIVDNNGGGSAAKTVTIKMQPDCPRYIRLFVVGEANGAATSNGTATLQGLF